MSVRYTFDKPNEVQESDFNLPFSFPCVPIYPGVTTEQTQLTNTGCAWGPRWDGDRMLAGRRDERSGQTKDSEIKVLMPSDETVGIEVGTAYLATMTRTAIAMLDDTVRNVPSCDAKDLLSGIDECHRTVVLLIRIVSVEHRRATTLGPFTHLVDVLNQRLRSHGAMAGRPTSKSAAACLGSIARQPQQSIDGQVYRKGGKGVRNLFATSCPLFSGAREGKAEKVSGTFSQHPALSSRAPARA